MNKQTAQQLAELVAGGATVTMGRARLNFESDAGSVTRLSLTRLTVEYQNITVVGQGENIDEAWQSAQQVMAARWAAVLNLLKELGLAGEE